MNFQTIFVLAIAALGATAFAAPGPQSSSAAPDSLVPVQSRNLDEFYLRPNANLASYRKVMIDPAQVAFRKDWNKASPDLHGVTRRLREGDAQRLADHRARSHQDESPHIRQASGLQRVHHVERLMAVRGARRCADDDPSPAPAKPERVQGERHARP